MFLLFDRTVFIFSYSIMEYPNINSLFGSKQKKKKLPLLDRPMNGTEIYGVITRDHNYVNLFGRKVCACDENVPLYFHPTVLKPLISKNCLEA